MHHCINSYAKVLEIACKSQAKSHQALCHQLSPNYQVPWAPKREAEESTTGFTSCKIVIMPKRWPASQATEAEGEQSNEKASRLQVAKRKRYFKFQIH